MSSAQYAGGRPKGPPSPEAKPDPGGATLIPTPLALNTVDPCEMFVEANASVYSKLVMRLYDVKVEGTETKCIGERRSCWEVYDEAGCDGPRVSEYPEKTVKVAVRDFFDSNGKKTGFRKWYGMVVPIWTIDPPRRWFRCPLAVNVNPFTILGPWNGQWAVVGEDGDGSVVTIERGKMRTARRGQEWAVEVREGNGERRAKGERWFIRRTFITKRS
ncbi:hypothetical protein BJY52DRAFT_1224740 [Lactarius psammicola]|nr:hypothetical protein BJY52DRAFT_1224740 [Lactarius psammicola]